MFIHKLFGRKKENTEELTLQRKESERSFDFFAVLSKAMLIFLIVYGAMGGFLSAYEIEYNKGFCMLTLFFFALFLCAVYETGKKWLMNLVNVLVLLAYFYIAISNYWVINSGYYAIMNRILEVAREYLNIANGTDYALMYENEYMAVTVFAMFICMVGGILLNIHMQNKVSLTKILILTLSPFIFPFYFEKSPDLIYILFLLIGYATVAVLHGTGVKEWLGGQMRYVLPVVTVLVVVVVRGAAFLIPQDTYDRIIPENVHKESTERAAAGFAQFGMSALFQGQQTGGGVSGGVLSQGNGPMSDYETDLIVRYTPYSFQSVYLKAFTGKDYDGTRWSKAEDELSEDALMMGTVAARMDAFEKMPEEQGRGIMQIKNVGAEKKYEYRPYYTDEMSIAKEGDWSTYTYYPSGGKVEIPQQSIDTAYLQVPDRCFNAVQQVCKEAGFQGTPEEVANQIVDFFQENYSYSLRPGYNYRNHDYITYFLLESKRGFCAHFASAGTMLFRYMGIPARYVEGYAFSYYDIVDAGKLVEGAEYADYYSGFSPLGETALIELEVPDARAHGWVEIYIDGRGWIVVDPTPSSNEADTTSFWEAFLNNNEGNDSGQLNVGADTIGTYLETAVGGVSFVLVVVGILVLFLLGVGAVLRLRRERALPMRSQVQLEYGKLKRELSQKYEKFERNRTVKEQLDFVRGLYGEEISDAQEDALYQAFFGREAEGGYEETLAFLRQLRRRCRKRVSQR
ncbi:MAG: transglutaminase domain-containing protein [Lachnospiraceae bacterium]|nr:transglutaminase domain-containing protein [Lachnospiraceae bacterium]